MKKSTKTILEFDDYIIEFDEEENVSLKYKNPNFNSIDFNYQKLNTGKLFINLETFNGFIFLDNNDNLYDTFHKKIYFKCSAIFEGDTEKEAFSLFNNYDLIEKKIIEGVNKINEESNDNKKKLIEKNICEELKKELNNFNLNNIKLKNGKFSKRHNCNIYDYIHENIIETYIKGTKDDKLINKGEFIQKIENNEIYVTFYGNMKYITLGSNIFQEKFCKIENLYNIIFRIRIKRKYNEYFFVNMNEVLKRGKKDEDNGHIILQMNNANNNGPIRIIIKDANLKNILYEINAKLSEKKELKGIGIVNDLRKGDMLMVNFDTGNVIANDFLSVIPSFRDKDEYNMYKNNLTKSLDAKTKYIKDEILNIDEIIKNEKKIQILAEKLNKKIVEKNIQNIGVKNQKYSGECWVYSLSLIICIANARKYGRKLENFDSVYNSIIKKYFKQGKTNEEIETIMEEILPNYGLSYEQVDNDIEIKKYMNKGVNCLVTFDLNNLEWYNFCDYFKDKSIKQEEKLLTLGILEKKKKIENPDEISGHSVILYNIDKSGNYILINSWGKEWANEGTFKTKKQCLKNGIFYAIYYDDDLLTQEEKNAWIKFKNNITKSLIEMKSIRCPKCQRSARIKQFKIKESNENKIELQCPYEESKFIIGKDNGMLRFIVGQLLSYDLDNNMTPEMKFNFVV